MNLWFLIFAAALLLVGWIVLYNMLVKFQNRVREAWSGIDVQLKRRYDLVPNLVETVKGYAGHEKSLLESVTRSRSQAQEAGSIAGKGVAEATLSQGLRNLFALAEAYPELKADQGFLRLQEQLVSIENEIQMARRYYNGAVRDFNNQVQMVPGNIVAAASGFKTEEFFQLDDDIERAAPDVRL